MSDDPPSRFRSVRRVALGCLAGTIVFITLQIVFTIVQLGPDPANWSRRGGQISSFGEPAFVHRDAAGACRLSSEHVGAVGMLSAYRIRRSTDDAFLFTGVIEGAKLDVVVRWESADVRDDPLWRDLAATYYDAPALRDATRRTRTIVFGYPADWVRAFSALFAWAVGAAAALTILAAIIYLPITIIRVISAATNPEVRRLATLQSGLCPKCEYIIRHLPERRCPECGEQWSAADLHPATLQHARIAARTGRPAPIEPGVEP